MITGWLGERFYLASDRGWGVVPDFDGRVRSCETLSIVNLVPHRGAAVAVRWVAVDPPLPGSPDREVEQAASARGMGSSFGGPQRPKAAEVLLQPDPAIGPLVGGDDPIPVFIYRILNAEARAAGSIGIDETEHMAGGLAVRLPELLPSLPERRFNEMFGLLCQFAFRHGSPDVPREHRENGEALGEWVLKMKSEGRPDGHFQVSPLPERWVQALEALPGWTWQ